MSFFQDQIVTRINQFFLRNIVATDEPTSLDELIPDSTAADFNATLYGGYSYRHVIEQCRLMYDEDTRVRQTVQTIARDLTKNGFEVTVRGARSKQYETIILETLNRIGFIANSERWVKTALKDGNCFLVKGVNEDGLITKMQRIPTLEVIRNTDSLDRFYNPEVAFTWQTHQFQGISAEQDFPLWSMVHARFDYEDNDRYGQPLYTAAVKVFYYMSDGEKNMWLRRKLRSGVRYVHKVLGGPAKVKEYKRVNKDALTNPASSIIDFFGNADISQLQGDARLSEIRDVLHFVETMAAASPLPLALIAYGMDINRDILNVKKEEYDENIATLGMWVVREFIKPIIDTQFLLLGILPETVDYDIRPISKLEVTPERLNAVFEAAIKMRAIGLSLDAIAQIISPLLPMLRIEEIVQGLSTTTTEPPSEPGSEESGPWSYDPYQRYLQNKEDGNTRVSYLRPQPNGTNGHQPNEEENLFEEVQLMLSGINGKEH